MIDMSEIINKQFDDFQKVLENKKKRYKFLTTANPGDEFYKLIDDISGSNLSDENNRREQNKDSERGA